MLLVQMYSFIVDKAAHLPIFHEKLHWLSLIAGFLIADSSEGEIPMIPDPLTNFSIAMHAKVNVNKYCLI